jgi:hypothetical protein
MSGLHDLFTHRAVESFGMALRFAIGKRDYGGGEDYSSLVELEYAEKIDQFLEVLKKFLRRYDSYARRYEREHEGRTAYRPTEKDLDDLVALAEQKGVATVSAALIAHALVRVERAEKGGE